VDGGRGQGDDEGGHHGADAERQAGESLQAAYAADRWDAARLGVPTLRGRGAVRFDTISEDWLRDPVKR
jgi:hypothetical protein